MSPCPQASIMTFLLFSCQCSLKAQLTAEIKQVGEEEGLFVEVFDGHHYGPIQTAAKGLLRPAFICYERLQHRAHHVELQGWDQRKARSVIFCRTLQPTGNHFCSFLKKRLQKPQLRGFKLSHQTVSHPSPERQVLPSYTILDNSLDFRNTCWESRLTKMTNSLWASTISTSSEH